MKTITLQTGDCITCDKYITINYILYDTINRLENVQSCACFFELKTIICLQQPLFRNSKKNGLMISQSKNYTI